ncbi:hypothetical protein QF000_000814 [Paraburkholderia atlantica]|uniref:Uncharacterized protein n=2 Tax=Paraburkholderia TaxID=1822464 RepID=A0A7W8LG28_9BURK|nr:hypothetical protein [Paraburkholderia youngii]MBB5421483.1 hypothetical protein [Paraburkholderia atlantica]MBB5429617.1 hypothetical protein [Paraburkholderia atlantica]
MAELACQVQKVATEETLKVAFADQGYTGDDPAQAAGAQGIDLQVVKVDAAKTDFTPAGLHFVGFATLMLVHAIPVIRSS